MPLAARPSGWTKRTRFFRAVRHAQPRQLVARLRRMVGARWRNARTVAVTQRLAEGAEAVPVRAVLPQPLLPPRTHQIQEVDGRYHVHLLGQTRTLDADFDWHPTDLEHSHHLWLFSLHYMEYLEGVNDAGFVQIVSDWLDKNPPFGLTHENSWHPYVTSLRCVVWMQQYAARPHLPVDFKARMAGSLVQQLRLLEQDLEVDLRGNHLLKNIKALLWAAHFFEGTDAERWQQTGLRLLREELPVQFLKDGLHYERSPAYHAQTFVDLLECLSLLAPGPDRAQVDTVVDRAAQALADVTHPDGLTSLFNDGGLHMAYAPTVCLDAYTALTGRHVSTRPVFALDDAGYYGLRTDAAYVLYDAGPIAPDFLPAHGHGDIFAFEWSLEHQRLIVDAGVYTYAAGPARAYVRATRTHNTVTLDGQDQCEFWGSFRVGRRAAVVVEAYQAQADGFTLTAQHTGYRHLEGRPIHRRTMEATPLALHIADEIVGGAGQRIESRLLCHPDCAVTLHPGGAVLHAGPVRVELQTQAEVRLEPAMWHPDFGVTRPCTQIVMDYGTAPGTGRYTLERVPILS